MWVKTSMKFVSDLSQQQQQKSTLYPKIKRDHEKTGNV